MIQQGPELQRRLMEPKEEKTLRKNSLAKHFKSTQKQMTGNWKSQFGRP